MSAARRLAIGSLLVLSVVVVAGFALLRDDKPRQRWTDFDDPPHTAGVQVGRTYEFSVNAHCGIHGAQIDGMWWRASPPHDDGQGNPPREIAGIGGVGQLRIVDRNRAVFQNNGLRVVFLRDGPLPEPRTCL